MPGPASSNRRGAGTNTATGMSESNALEAISQMSPRQTAGAVRSAIERTINVTHAEALRAKYCACVTIEVFLLLLDKNMFRESFM